MANFVNAYDVINGHTPTMYIGDEISTVSIDAYLKHEERYRGCDWNPRNIEIDEEVIGWLENNTEGNWTLDMCGREVNFENNEDGWRFLEWLEEYELKNG